MNLSSILIHILAVFTFFMLNGLADIFSYTSVVVKSHSKDIWPCFHKIVCSRETNPQAGYMQKQYSTAMAVLRELWNQWGCIAKGFCSIEARTMISLLTRWLFLNITFVIFSSFSLSHTLSTIYGFVPLLIFFLKLAVKVWDIKVYTLGFHR